MIYITGDTHGNYERLSSRSLAFMQPGDTLIVCGDFGFVWDGSPKEASILKKLGNRRYRICFIDGTHENFRLLGKYADTEWQGGLAARISGNLYHLKRGSVFTIENKKIFVMGGGELPDAEYRSADSAESRPEMPSKPDFLRAVSSLEACNYKVDYIITHEPPSTVREFLTMKDPENATVSALNSFLNELSVQCEYSKWYFGSLHVDKFISSRSGAVFRNVVDAATGMPAKIR